MPLLSPTVSAAKAISMLFLMTGPFVHIEAKERQLRINTKRETSFTTESSGVAGASIVAAVVTDETGDQRCTASDTTYEEFFHGQWNTRPLAGGTKCCPHADGSKRIILQHMSFDCPKQDSGIRFDVPSSDIVNEGWTRCYNGTYDDGIEDTDIDDGCQGNKIMYGCKSDSSPTWSLIGYGSRDKALTNTKGGPNAVGTMDGDVQWYNTGEAIGFAHKDDALDFGEAIGSGSFFPCDYQPSGRLDRRLCWIENYYQDLGDGSPRKGVGGYRCGATKGLFNATNWERGVWVRN